LEGEVGGAIKTKAKEAQTSRLKIIAEKRAG